MMKKPILICIFSKITEIYKVMLNTPSDYVQGRKMLSEANIIIDSKPGKARKIVHRARRRILRESIVARRYNAIHDTVVLTNDSHIKELDRRYHQYLDNGDYAKAEKIIQKLYESETIIDLKPVVSIIYNGTKNGLLQFEIVSASSTRVDINCISVCSNGKVLERDVRSPFCMSPGNKKTVTCVKEPEADEVDIEVEYTRDGERRTITKKVSLMEGVA